MSDSSFALNLFVPRKAGVQNKKFIPRKSHKNKFRPQKKKPLFKWHNKNKC